MRILGNVLVRKEGVRIPLNGQVTHAEGARLDFPVLLVNSPQLLRRPAAPCLALPALPHTCFVQDTAPHVGEVEGVSEHRQGAVHHVHLPRSLNQPCHVKQSRGSPDPDSVWRLHQIEHVDDCQSAPKHEHAAPHAPISLHVGCHTQLLTTPSPSRVLIPSLRAPSPAATAATGGAQHDQCIPACLSSRHRIVLAVICRKVSGRKYARMPHACIPLLSRHLLESSVCNDPIFRLPVCSNRSGGPDSSYTLACVLSTN